MRGKLLRSFSPSSLADIAFLVLIVWICASLPRSIREEELWGQGSELSPVNHSIRVSVLAHHLIEIDGREVSVSEGRTVYELILARLESNPSQPVLLTTARGVDSADVVRTLDILRTIEKNMRVTSPQYKLPLTVNTIASN